MIGRLPLACHASILAWAVTVTVTATGADWELEHRGGGLGFGEREVGRCDGWMMVGDGNGLRGLLLMEKR